MTLPLESYQSKRDQLAKVVGESCQNSPVQLSLYKKTSNLFRSRGNDSKKIDVRSFNNVLAVDREQLCADVEGMTTYDNLVRATLPYDCLPLVVPELKSITVGGAAAGCGIESSSFRYGLAHEGIREMEVLLSAGDVVQCSPEGKHSDLFYAFPNTFGSLGYGLRFKVALMPVKKYVALRHQRFHNAGAYFSALEQLCLEQRTLKEIAYIDGVIFSPREMYITTAVFVDSAPFLSNYRYRNIYYRSLQKLERDYLSINDYIWRWDTDWFWCSKVFGLQNPLLRLLVGKSMLNSTTYGKVMHFFHRHPRLASLFYTQKRESVIQDVLVPCSKAEAFFDFMQSTIGIYPIWICPSCNYHPSQKYTFCPINDSQLYFDFGFWDSIPSQHEQGYYNRLIEDEAVRLGAFKSLYSISYYSEDQFWQIFNRPAYDALKAKYDPQGHLRTLYQKSCSPGIRR